MGKLSSEMGESSSTTMRAYLGWLFRNSVDRWGGRADVYIALTTYIIIFAATLGTFLLGGQSNLIQTASQWILFGLAILGIAALGYDLCFGTPHRLWLRLQRRLSTAIKEITEMTREGRELKDEIRNGAAWSDKYATRATSWEQRVRGWLGDNRPEDEESFLIDSPEAIQGWQPTETGPKDFKSATLANTLDRRLAALNKIMVAVRQERETIL